MSPARSRIRGCNPRLSPRDALVEPPPPADPFESAVGPTNHFGGGRFAISRALSRSTILAFGRAAAADQYADIATIRTPTRAMTSTGRELSVDHSSTVKRKSSQGRVMPSIMC